MKNTTTAQTKLNEFYLKAGTDMSTYSPEDKKEHLALSIEVDKEAKKVSAEDKSDYETLCKKYGIKVSDKFRGWVVSERKGKKPEDGSEAKVTQIVVGLKAEVNGRLFHFDGFISPKKDRVGETLATKIDVAKALSSL